MRADLLHFVNAAGITLRVEGDRLVARPSSLISAELRSLLRSRRDELRQQVIEVHQVTAKIIASCDKPVIG